MIEYILQFKMNKIRIINREMTTQEFARMNKGFDEHSLENNVAIQDSDRFTFVSLDEEKFVGCASGLAYKNGEMYSGWFYLTDLFVEKAYRSNGLGTILLKSIEEAVAAKGIKHIWLWTSHDGALRFYRRHGYSTFTEMENWYSDGNSRVGLRKNL
jgi:ribosomal protein S18 acetylase RimI-like enzyme